MVKLMVELLVEVLEMVELEMEVYFIDSQGKLQPSHLRMDEEVFEEGVNPGV